jgi:hypothetical protein
MYTFLIFEKKPFNLTKNAFECCNLIHFNNDVMKKISFKIIIIFYHILSK